MNRTEKNTGTELNASAPKTSLVRMRDPSRFDCRSTYSFTEFRTSMKPSVTVIKKMSVEIAQTTYVWPGLDGAYSPKLNEPCHTTSVNRMTSSKTADP